MEDEILNLEQAGTYDEAVQSLFRAAHTLKGSSAAMGFENMKQLTHEMEHLLDQVRSKKLIVTAPMIDLLFKSLDGLKQLKDEIVGGSQTITDISTISRELHSFSGEATTIAPVAVAVFSHYQKPGLSLDIRLKAEEAKGRGQNVYWVHIRISADSLIKGARAYVIYSNMNVSGEVLLCDPDLESIEGTHAVPMDIAFLYASDLSETEAMDYLSSLSEVVDVKVEVLDVEETPADIPVPGIQPLAVHEQQSPIQTDKSRATTVRVSVERLEHLMNLVGELIIDQTRINQVERTLSRKFASDESVNELEQVSDHLSRIIGDLQESVMKARMLPLEQLFNRFPRMIRDLAKNLGKEVELQIEGQDTELDRSLIEEITDPLIHLIRNAVDHGIEQPDIRVQAGKNPGGRLIIRAVHEDNQVVIYVEDDGNGIDPVKMIQLAVAKGVINEQEASQLSDREAIHLIFKPGFSTSNTVSDVSGRGVGMDIVKSHIEKLNGLIDIATEVGKGTRFKIKLPLTLAIITGLLVKLNARTVIIPMSNIAEIVRAGAGDIQTIRGQSVIVLRGQIIPVIQPDEYFQVPKLTGRKGQLPLVIVGTAEKRVALAVDELIGNQEIVIKSLGSYIGKVPFITGATILGDGRVALILEISSIIKKVSADQVPITG
jgi:two-component system chemotaxis sensor kinase CheA